MEELDPILGEPDSCSAEIYKDISDQRIAAVKVYGRCKVVAGERLESMMPDFVSVEREPGSECATYDETGAALWGDLGRWETSDLDFDDLGNCLQSPSTTSDYCNDEHPCSGWYKVVLKPDPNDPEPPVCADYRPAYLRIATQKVLNMAGSTESADCVAGSGRFLLAPHLSGDNDHDGRFRVHFVPIMKSGSGTMTRLGNVTSITPVQAWPSGSVARVIRSDGALAFNADDSLKDASDVSTVIGGTTTFEALMGQPLFVGEGLEANAFGPYEMDMTWTCPSSSGPFVPRPPGWTLSLATMGCQLKQKVTLRRDVERSEVRIEPYGNPWASEVVKTTPTQDGHQFVWTRPGLWVQGTWLSTSENEAVVRLDGAATVLSSVCTPGNYTFVPE